MNKTLLFPVLLLMASIANAHVSLSPAQAEAGTTYRGALSVVHGCDGAPTTSVDVQLPGGTTHTFEVKDKASVAIEFPVPKKPGALWIKAVQRCGTKSAEWNQAPAQGVSTEGLKNPAMLLQVLTREEMGAMRMLPSVEGGWVRASVAGQQSTGAFMRITVNEPTKLVGASSPVAGIAEVHEMKMEGDVMRMRPAGPVDLPVGRAFELKPGGYHLMLQDLKAPVAAGSKVPVTLVFRNAQGLEMKMALQLPVVVAAPAAGHKH